jgi:predicted RNA-binding protein YlqC (UPF0109 family)
MTDFGEVCDWLLKTVRLIADYPDEVVVEAVPGDQQVTLRIRANPKDVGKVIGRQGRTSQSIRVLVGTMGKKLNWRFIVDINEDNKSL